MRGARSGSHDPHVPPALVREAPLEDRGRAGGEVRHLAPRGAVDGQAHGRLEARAPARLQHRGGQHARGEQRRPGDEGVEQQVRALEVAVGCTARPPGAPATRAASKGRRRNALRSFAASASRVFQRPGRGGGEQPFAGRGLQHDEGETSEVGRRSASSRSV